VREKKWPRVNCWIRLILAIFMVVAVFVLCAHLGGIESPATNDDLLVLLAVLVVFHLPALLRSTTLFFSFRRKSAENIRHQRASLWHVSYNMLSHLPLAFVLVISFGHLWSFDSIGFSSRFHWIANATLRGRIESVCRDAAFEPPIICTPEEIAGDDENV